MDPGAAPDAEDEAHLRSALSALMDQYLSCEDDVEISSTALSEEVSGTTLSESRTEGESSSSAQTRSPREVTLREDTWKVVNAGTSALQRSYGNLVESGNLHHLYEVQQNCIEKTLNLNQLLEDCNDELSSARDSMQEKIRICVALASQIKADMTAVNDSVRHCRDMLKTVNIPGDGEK